MLINKYYIQYHFNQTIKHSMTNDVVCIKLFQSSYKTFKSAKNQCIYNRKITFLQQIEILMTIFCKLGNTSTTYIELG